MDKIIIILERRLFSAIGHERTQINAINELLGNKKSIVIASEGININDMPFENKVIPKLPKLNLVDEGKETIEYIQESGDILIKLLNQKELKKIQKIIIPSARRVEIALITYLYNEKKIPLNLKTVLRIHDIVFLENLPKATLKIFSQLVNQGLIKLFSETEELSKKIEHSFKIKSSGSLIFPVSVPYKINIKSKKEITDEIFIGCLGGPRRSKGMFTIPKIIKNLRMYFQKNKEDFRVTFIIQMSKNKKKRSILFKINEYLSRHISNSVNVKYIYGTEDSNEFISLLKQVDIFLLPYSKIQYKYCGSGFITDAIFLEKPIITVKDMSMQNLRKFKNAISADNVEGYSNAIIRISKNYKYYVKNSKLAKKYLKNNIKKSFNKIL
ncbi:hypothetical protein N9489_01370 [Methylophilaceae bacterium]|nr:hypothetical protein [Methylophilaceae bacterium]